MLPSNIDPEEVYVREYVEYMITQRLNTRYYGEKEIDNDRFEQVINKIKPLIDSTAKNNNIPGFTEEDLEGLLLMKVNQLMRRGNLDFQKNIVGYCQKTFKQLLIHVYNAREMGLRRGMRPDPMDNLSDFSDLNISHRI